MYSVLGDYLGVRSGNVEIEIETKTGQLDAHRITLEGSTLLA